MSKINVAESVLTVGTEIKNAECSYLTQRCRNQRIELKTYDSICYLKSGSVSVYHIEKDIVTITIKAPAILGLAQMRNDIKSHYLRCDSDCEMWVISTCNAEDLLTRSGFCQHVFDILTRHLQLYFQHENMVSHHCVCEIVTEHLKYTWSLHEPERSRASIYKFILLRNSISRSSVHKILQLLEANGDIRIARGRLVHFRVDF